MFRVGKQVVAVTLSSMSCLCAFTLYGECLQTCPYHVLQSTIVMALLEIVDGSRSALRISNPPKHIFHHRFSHLDVSFCGDHEYVLTAPFSGSSDPEILQRVRTGQYSFPEKHFAKVSRQAKVGTQ
jgi:hypothetical protein